MPLTVVYGWTNRLESATLRATMSMNPDTPRDILKSITGADVKRLSYSSWAILGVLCMTTPLWASGFFVARFGGEHGHPTTDSLTAMYYNPAGLALGKGTRLYIDGNLAYRIFSYQRAREAVTNPLAASVFDTPCARGQCEAGTPEADIAANAGKGTLNNFLASPFIGVASDFGLENASFGLSLYAPFGGSSTYDKVDKVGNHPGSVDGAQRWWAIEGTIKSVYITAAAAYRIPQYNLSIGLGINVVKNQVFTSRAKTFSNDDDLITRDPYGARYEVSEGQYLKEGRAIIEVESTELALGAGVIWQPKNNVWLGVSYQSSPGFGENKLEGKARLILGAEPEQNPNAVLYQHLPDVWQFGGRWRPQSDVELRLFGNYVRWSLFKDQCALNVDVGSDERSNCDTGPLFVAPRNWTDGLSGRIGASYWFKPSIEGVVGAGYDTNSVPDSTLEPALVDMNKATVSLGARFVLMDSALAFATTFTQVIYFEREIQASSQEPVLVKESGARVGPNAAGTFEQSVSVLNLNVEYSF
jgi:long-chain fatty acid transport protein